MGNNRMGWRRTPLALGIAVALAGAPQAFAADYDWQGDTSSDWAMLANWGIALVPTNTVRIDWHPITFTGVAPIVSTSEMAIFDDMYVGINNGNSGTLTIQSGGVLPINGTAYIGFGTGSNGLVTVDGAGSLLATGGDLIVGLDGTGALTVSAGGQVSSLFTAIGSGGGSLGTVLVTGNGSTLSSNSVLWVGNVGSGRLTLADGGHVDAYNGMVIGVDSSSNGTVTVTGANSALTVNNSLLIGQTGAIGLLNIGGASNTPAEPGMVNASNIVLGAGGTGMLVFNHTDTSGNYTFAPPISGTGSIVLLAGTTVFTGNSASFTGNTAVDANGALILNGSLGGGVGVSGMLGGTGTVNGVGTTVNIWSGGNIAPGNSVGTLTVPNIYFDAGAIYTVELNDGGNTAGVNNDFINATGTADISSGASVHVTPENGTDDGSTYTPGTTYTILTAAGGVTVNFGAVTDDYAFLNFTLSGDANNVYLTSLLADPCLVGYTLNQCATAEGVVSLGAGGLYTAVLNLSTAEAPGALDQLSGEIHASARTALIDDSRFPRQAALERLRSAYAGATGSAMAERRNMGGSASWGQIFGSQGSWDGDGNAAKMERTVQGVFLGADAPLSGNVRVGLLAGYHASDFDVKARTSSGENSSWTLGAYGGSEWDRWSLRLGSAYTWHELDMKRSVAFTGYSDSLAAKYDARTAQVFGEAGYRIDYGKASFEPFANLAWVNLKTDGFTETGGEAALTVANETSNVTFTTLGLRGETLVGLGNGQGRLYGAAGWRHAFGDMPSLDMTFAGGDVFNIAGVPISRNTLTLELGLDMKLTSRSSLALSYGGQFGSGLNDQDVKANLTVNF